MQTFGLVSPSSSSSAALDFDVLIDFWASFIAFKSRNLEGRASGGKVVRGLILTTLATDLTFKSSSSSS
jgi:hypothetical protein